MLKRRMHITIEFYRNNPPGPAESYFSRPTPEFADLQEARNAAQALAEAVHMEARYIIIQPGRMKPEHWALGDDGAWRQVK